MEHLRYLLHLLTLVPSSPSALRPLTNIPQTQTLGCCARFTHRRQRTRCRPSFTHTPPAPLFSLVPIHGSISFQSVPLTCMYVQAY
ncbi:hypothetical protein GGS26DRAFT_570968 [Hypomontagnella submonticulosa]|nr:hypothetical protein GGS26DRAFT_570968 [Hypomontagnella submonticulosa]